MGRRGKLFKIQLYCGEDCTSRFREKQTNKIKQQKDVIGLEERRKERLNSRKMAS